MQHFVTLFRNAYYVHVVSSSSGSGQSHTKYISWILEAKFLLHFDGFHNEDNDCQNKLSENKLKVKH